LRKIQSSLSRANGSSGQRNGAISRRADRQTDRHTSRQTEPAAEPRQLCQRAQQWLATDVSSRTLHAVQSEPIHLKTQLLFDALHVPMKNPGQNGAPYESQGL